MKIFGIGKKERKIYSLSEAIKLLQTSKYKNYTTIPVGNGYQLVPMERKIQVAECQEKSSSIKAKRCDFLNRMTKKVNKEEFIIVPNYNNYQSAKRYNPNQGIGR